MSPTKFLLSVCVLEASSFHITLVFAEYCARIGFQTICDVINHLVGPASLKKSGSSVRKFTV